MQTRLQAIKDKIKNHNVVKDFPRFNKPATHLADYARGYLKPILSPAEINGLSDTEVLDLIKDLVAKRNNFIKEAINQDDNILPWDPTKNVTQALHWLAQNNSDKYQALFYDAKDFNEENFTPAEAKDLVEYIQNHRLEVIKKRITDDKELSNFEEKFINTNDVRNHLNNHPIKLINVPEEKRESKSAASETGLNELKPDDLDIGQLEVIREHIIEHVFNLAKDSISKTSIGSLPAISDNADPQSIINYLSAYFPIIRHARIFSDDQLNKLRDKVIERRIFLMGEAIANIDDLNHLPYLDKNADAASIRDYLNHNNFRSNYGLGNNRTPFDQNTLPDAEALDLLPAILKRRHELIVDIIQRQSAPLLAAQLANQKDTVVKEISQYPQPVIEERERHLHAAFTYESVKKAMQEFGLDVSDPRKVNEIVKENRDRKYLNAQRQPFDYTNQQNLDKINERLRQKGKHYRLLNHLEQEVKLSVDSNANLERIKIIEEDIFQLNLIFTQLKKIAQDAAPPSNNARALTALHIQQAGVAAFIAELDEKLALIKSIEENLAKIHEQKGKPSHRAYFSDQEAKEAKTYEDALQHVQSILGGQVPSLGGLAAGSPSNTTEEKVNIRVVPLKVSNIQTATIQTKTPTYARSEFYFADIAAIAQTKKIGGFFTTNIPSQEILIWAKNKIDDFQAFSPKLDEPIRIEQGNMPKDFVKALVLYCNFKKIPCTPPTGFKISPEEIALYNQELPKLFPKELSAETVEATSQTLRPRSPGSGS